MASPPTITFRVKLKRPRLRDMIISAARALVLASGGLLYGPVTWSFGWLMLVCCYTEPEFK